MDFRPPVHDDDQIPFINFGRHDQKVDRWSDLSINFGHHDQNVDREPPQAASPDPFINFGHHDHRGPPQGVRLLPYKVRLSIYIMSYIFAVCVCSVRLPCASAVCVDRGTPAGGLQRAEPLHYRIRLGYPFILCHI